jgi:hypothetical protein
MSDSYPVDNPPLQLNTMPTPSESVREREKSAVREAITAVCEDGAKSLQGWLDRIDDGTPYGAKQAMGMFLKLLEFSMPKLQRVTVEDPNGQPMKMPVININFAPISGIKVVETDAIDTDPVDE